MQVSNIEKRKTQNSKSRKRVESIKRLPMRRSPPPQTSTSNPSGSARYVSVSTIYIMNIETITDLLRTLLMC